MGCLRVTRRGSCQPTVAGWPRRKGLTVDRPGRGQPRPSPMSVCFTHCHTAVSVRSKSPATCPTEPSPKDAARHCSTMSALNPDVNGGRGRGVFVRDGLHNGHPLRGNARDRGSDPNRVNPRSSGWVSPRRRRAPRWRGAQPPTTRRCTRWPRWGPGPTSRTRPNSPGSPWNAPARSGPCAIPVTRASSTPGRVSCASSARPIPPAGWRPGGCWWCMAATTSCHGRHTPVRRPRQRRAGDHQRARASPAPRVEGDRDPLRKLDRQRDVVAAGT
jgi:hypothetical protein